MSLAGKRTAAGLAVSFFVDHISSLVQAGTQDPPPPHPVLLPTPVLYLPFDTEQGYIHISRSIPAKRLTGFSRKPQTDVCKWDRSRRSFNHSIYIPLVSRSVGVSIAQFMYTNPMLRERTGERKTGSPPNSDTDGLDLAKHYDG